MRSPSKGAPDILLARCASERVGEEIRPLTPERRAEIQATIDELAQDGAPHARRRLSLFEPQHVTGAITEAQEEELIWLGAVGMIDPPREEAKGAVRWRTSAGVRSIMITGDHPTTAAAIAEELGILEKGGRAVTGAELQKTDDDATCANWSKKFLSLRALRPSTNCGSSARSKPNGEHRRHDGGRRE